MWIDFNFWKVFFPIEAEEELLKLYKVSVNARSINICIEHYNLLNKYKLIKFKLKGIINDFIDSSEMNNFFNNMNTQNKLKLIKSTEVEKSISIIFILFIFIF